MIFIYTLIHDYSICEEKQTCPSCEHDASAFLFPFIDAISFLEWPGFFFFAHAPTRFSEFAVKEKYTKKITRSSLIPFGKPVTISLPTNELDVKKIKRSFMPNLIHSLDVSNIHILLSGNAFFLNKTNKKNYNMEILVEGEIEYIKIG